MDKLISDIIDVPETVRKGDFVLNLSRGVTEPEKTLHQYVVTPQLAACFEDALGFIRSAVDAANSKACYLHGSFGSGKSHYMAVLHLLLQHNPAVRSLEYLDKVCAKHAWVEDKKFLLIPYHMIGARNMESAILGGYVDHVMHLHPGAPLPGVYLADDIFKNAQQHRQALGDEKFFGQLNKAEGGRMKDEQEKGSVHPSSFRLPPSKGWGKLARGWDAARFEAALEAPPASEERTRLVGDLVQHIFPAFKGIASGKDEAFVDLDVGLSIISAHAKSLGYDGLILFLDELILWLATHSADLNFVQTEGNKLAKLVESRKTERPVPIISFVARQRDLRELIGENVTGVDQLNFSDVLSHWEGRFHTITLEDRNLPLIAHKRVLRPKNDACKVELEDAFEKTAQVRAEIMEILLTREADRAMFKLVYPFSPALIQALVAVSSALQRERTALKIMLQLLVNRRDTLRLGDVIPLGDLWDVVAHGDEAFTDVMRVNFENAKKLYQTKLLPMLEQQHEIDLEVDRERVQKGGRMKDEGGNESGSDSAFRLSPSALAEVAERLQRFENDDRLIKSLLLSALVHGVDALKNMTCTRLAALNHGTIRSRIPGREHQVVAQKLRQWVDLSGGVIHLSDDPVNPTVSIQLSGVETESIIEAARVYDNPGNRQFKIRGILFKSLGVPEQDEMFITHTFWWRGSKRTCDVLFTNVRTLTDEALRANQEWKLIIDFPFDADGHSPNEDLDRLTRFREKNERQQTMVWLPSIFSPRTQSELGKLVIIDRLLLGNNLDQYAKHLSLQDRETARLLLKNQQSALSSRLLQIVESAYAIRTEPPPGSLDTAYDMSESHFQSLYPSLQLQRPVGATLGEALIHLLDQALAHQYPKHPLFGQEIKFGKDLKQVLEVCQEAARTTDGRVFVDDKDRLRHKHGIVHRDLKPGNVMINQRGEPIVMDFGLARLNRGPALSSSGQIVGTPSYMPPEQAKGDTDDIGPWSDVYSLGVIFYELLTGSVPFKGHTLSVLFQVVHEDPPPPSAITSVDSALEAICLRAMAKDRTKRFQSMTELASALEAYQRGEAVSQAHKAEAGSLVPAGLRQHVEELLLLLRTWGLEEGLARSKQRLRSLPNDATQEVVAALHGWISGDDTLESRASALKSHPEWTELVGWSQVSRTYALLNKFDMAQAEARLQQATGKYLDCSTTLRATLAFLRGFYHLRIRQWDQALGAFIDSLSLFGQGHYWTGRLLRSLGRVYEGKCNFFAAREFFRQAVLCQQTAKDEKGLILTYEEFGRLFLAYGDLDQAEQHLTAGLRLAQRHMDHDGQAQLLNHLGRLAMARANREEHSGKTSQAKRSLTEAEEYLQASAKHNQSHGRVVEEARARKDQALLALMRSQVERASEHVERALSLMEQIAHPRASAEIRQALGLLRHEQKQYEQAEEALRQAILTYEANQDWMDAARSYVDLARTMQAQGVMKRFITEALEQALDRAEASRSSCLVAQVEAAFKSFDEEAYGRRIFRRLRGRHAPEDTSSLELGWSESISALFMDLQEFVPYCQGLDPEDVMLTLNQMLADFADVLHTYGGEVTTYLGGGFLALFRETGHADRAVAASLDLAHVLKEFNRPREVLGLRTIAGRITVASGMAWLGNIGTYHKMSFTAIGNPLNLASRLVRQGAPYTPVISQETFDLVKDHFNFREDSPRTVDLTSFGQRQIWDVIGRKPDSSRLPSMRSGPVI